MLEVVRTPPGTFRKERMIPMKKRLRWALVLLAGLLLLMLTACNDETDVPITSDA